MFLVTPSILIKHMLKIADILLTPTSQLVRGVKITGFPFAVIADEGVAILLLTKGGCSLEGVGRLEMAPDPTP